MGGFPPMGSVLWVEIAPPIFLLIEPDDVGLIS